MKTGLKDTTGRDIKTGQIVHWSDGGDDLSLEDRIKTRWDRIAVVSMKGILPQFTVIDSPFEETINNRHTFCYGSFIYQDTENHLTIVADSEQEYIGRFANAGQCMEYVLIARKQGK